MMPKILGILNVTPDSFSEGGRFTLVDQAVSHAQQMIADGAAMVDIGGESTRPGSDPVSVDEELARVMPACEKLASLGIPFSIDTSKPEVAASALDAGASLVNDVNGLRDLEMMDLVTKRNCPVCIMHMQGKPKVMQTNPAYRDVVLEVLEFLTRQAEQVENSGVSPENIWIDPGIGFGKTLEHNLSLIRHLETFVQTGFPVLLGVSRKSYLVKILGDCDPSDRLEGTLATELYGAQQGVAWIRTHDVKGLSRALTVQSRILESS